MPRPGREYRMAGRTKQHQCLLCGEWKPSTAAFYHPTGRGGLHLAGTCRACYLKARPALNEKRDAAVAIATRAIERVRMVSQAPIYTYEPPPKRATPDTDVYAPSIFDLSTAPPLGFLFADYDATLGLRFDPVELD